MKAIAINDFNNQKIKESEVILRILKGEKELYEILVRRNNQKLYRVVRSYLKDEAEIEDVMQNSYLKAYSKLYQFKLEASFSTWLIRIAINESLKRLKEKGKVYTIQDFPKDTTQIPVLEIPDTKRLSPQDLMIQKETKLVLENAIDALELKYRTVYILKEIEELSLKEIAQILNITVANVKVRSHRAKAMLKEKLYELSSDTSIFEFGFNRCDRITEQIMKHIS